MKNPATENQHNNDNPQSFIDRWRLKLAEKFLTSLYGRAMFVSSKPSNLVAGCVIFWYVENGTRNFLMVQNEENSQARFISCLGLGDNQNISTAITETVKSLLGKVFYRSLDKQFLSNDRVVAAPSFASVDEVTRNNIPVVSLVWAMQITPEQAQMCEPENNIEVIGVPEFSMMGANIAQSHQIIYQSALSHIHKSNPIPMLGEIDALEDLFKTVQINQRTIH